MPDSQEHISTGNQPIRHRKRLLLSKTVGCFHCLGIFSPTRIEEWIDEDDAGVAQTALCPSCGIDSVIPVTEDIDEALNLLKQMQLRSF